MNLVIVESPAKGKTIEQYLGKGYRVVASFGHVRDLPKTKLGVDLKKNYAPSYIIPGKAKKIVAGLKKDIKDVEKVFLATDYDREGEAIAWHIVQALDLEDSKKTSVKRITFHEITEPAIKKAIDKPRDIDLALVDAQQARRVLDRLVGYSLSPFLWKKVYTGLSAGRVQSVAVRLIVDRERAIQAFAPIEYWTIKADLAANNRIFTASLISYNDKKIDKPGIKTQKQAADFIDNLERAKYKIAVINEKIVNRNPQPPFRTSTLQQSASHQLGYSAKRTMALAQRLYEHGYITYMRTDSLNLSETALAETRSYIDRTFGSKYLPEKPKVYKARQKGAQEAHEAIRPTDPAKTPEAIRKNLDSDQWKIYDLIWKRLIASQMNPARFNQISLDIEAKHGQDQGMFRASGQNLVFDGYLKLWPEKPESPSLPKVAKGEPLELKQVRSEQHYTEPPPRFNEASLIKALEEYGIGRPSTYAPIISTIVDRGYTRLDNRQFIPQEVGFIVTDLLKEHFPDIVDVSFTATVEEDLDDIAEGKKQWIKVIDQFYTPFAKHLLEKEKSVKKQQTEEPTDEKCKKCGKPMVIKLGRFGRFMACTGFPDCKNTKAILKSTGIKCLECEKGDIVERTTRRGRRFWGCSRYPKCKYATWDDPLAKTAESAVKG